MRIRITRIVDYYGFSWYRVTEVGNSSNIIVSNRTLEPILLSFNNQSDRYIVVNKRLPDELGGDYIIKSKYE